MKEDEDILLQAEQESNNVSQEAFLKIVSQMFREVDENAVILQAAWIDTVLGPMIAIADDTSLYLLEFALRKRLTRELKRLQHRGFTIIAGDALPLTSIEAELKAYFEGALTQFKTPYRTSGSSFQQQVWQGLCQIPYGETRSYKEQAMSLGRSSSYRAVGNANGSNQLAIIIPCHRVIASDGTLGGYGGGLAVKQWLLAHEQRHKGSQ